MNEEQKSHIKYAAISATVPLLWFAAGVEILRGFEDLPEAVQSIEAHVLIPASILLMYLGVWPAFIYGLHSLDELIQALGGDNPDTVGKFMRGDHF